MKTRPVLQYKVFPTNTEFVEWQQNNPEYAICTTSPMMISMNMGIEVSNLDASTNIGIFVTFTEAYK